MSEPRIALVVAMAENRVIGRDGGLPWRMADDLRWFKRVTLGKPVIMGRTTFASIGKPLPGRTNIVLSRRAEFAPDGAQVAGSLEDGLALAKEAAARAEAEEICVIGGGAVYAEALPRADRIYRTVIEAEVEGDTRFPALAPDRWTASTLERIAPDGRNDHPARIELLERA
ncbi:dihydrofolate reductase [Parvularcula oceani]|uniref:dihydrofolate reductase n=1 Tax=Parvularcula oceani TaxID=1247963 RepID=UPI0004E0E0EA|nr:dihydrofolate reductase [Parvularcula oceani]